MQERLTSSEFVEWKSYLNLSANDFRTIDYYLAQIAAEVRRLTAKNPRKVEIGDMLLKFGEEAKKAKVKATAKSSKSFWLTSFGIKE